jgi:hypothetical protein
VPSRVWSLLSSFLYDELRDPPSPLPDRATPEWAAGIAMAAFDDAETNGTPPAGLKRFLNKRLALDETSPVLPRWAGALVPGKATLTDLLAPPPSEPHRTGGILTDAALLVARPSISRRGELMSDALFCAPLPPHPPNVPPPPPPEPGETRRETLQRSLVSAYCAACHSAIDPLGYSLEHFDELGRYRDLDNGKPVDSSGTYNQANLSFASIDDLAPRLATSCDVALCFTETMLAHAFQIESGNLKPEEIARVANAFADGGFSIRTLVRTIVTTF